MKKIGYNTLNISITHRKQEIEIMRALGASRSQICLMVLQEAFLLGLAGAGFGVFVGYFLAKGALLLIAKTVTSLYLISAIRHVSLTREIVSKGFLIGIVCTLISSAIPLSCALKIRPHLATGTGVTIHEDSCFFPGYLFNVLAVLCFIVAYIFVQFVAGRFRRPLLGGYGAILGVIMGFSLLCPVIIERILPLIIPVLEKFFSFFGRFSAENIRENKLYASISIAALAASLAMLISVGIMMDSFRGTVYQWTKQTLQADLYLSASIGFIRGTGDRLRSELRERVRKIEGIAQTAPYRFMHINYGENKIGLASSDLTLSLQKNTISLKNGDREKIVQQVLDNNGVLISENLELKYGLKPGDSITLQTPSGERAFPIYGLYYDYTNDLGVVYMDRELYKKVWKEDYISTLGVYLESGPNGQKVDGRKVAGRIRKALGKNENLLIMSGQELRDKAISIFDQTFHIFFALEFIAIVVALLGITNSLMISIMQRRREIALLRSIGAFKSQIKKMVMLEAAIMGLLGCLLGIVSGVVISFIMVYVILKGSFGWTIQYGLHYRVFSWSLLPVFITTLLAGYFPARKAKNIPLAEELRHE